MRKVRLAAIALVGVLALAVSTAVAADSTLLKAGALSADLSAGQLANVRVNGKVALREFGAVYVNRRGHDRRDMPLQRFIERTRRTRGKGDLFFVSTGVMRTDTQLVGEFGRVWAVRKGQALELTLHPTYFQDSSLPDDRRPWSMDVKAKLDKRLWQKALLIAGGKTLKVSDLKAIPSNVKSILLPISPGARLSITHLNMPDSFSVKAAGDMVELNFSDHRAKTTWFLLTDCPSVRLTLMIERTM